MRVESRAKRSFVILFVLFVFLGISSTPKSFAEGRWVDDLPKVRLTTQDGKEVQLEDLLKGKIVVISLMYTECKGICERGTSNLVQVQKGLGDRFGREVFIYSITIDPEHDTPEVLKEYAKTHGAKWMFLRGKEEDITALRSKLGLSSLTPELRQKLGLRKPDANQDADPRQHSGMIFIGNEPFNRREKVRILSTPEAILQVIDGMKQRQSIPKTLPAIVGNTTALGGLKSIEAKPDITWEPPDTSASVGDVIEWKMGAGSGAQGHGVRITNWAAVKDHVEVEPVAGQQPFNETTGRNDAVSTTDGQVLLRLKIKSVPPAPAEITYNCIRHGNGMKGTVSVSAAVATAPVASAPAPIEAKPDRTWQPPDTSASVGDVIEWKMGVGNQALGMPHGVRITNWAAVKAHLEVEPVAGQQPFDETTGQNGNPSTTDGQVLLRLKIKSVPPAPAEITYNCIVHGNIMKGKVSVSAPAPASAPAPIEAKPDRTWQPPDTSASVGDVIEWKMGAGSGAQGHGVRITNWAAVKAHLEVEPVAGQQPFDETTGQNGNPSTTDGQVLLRLKIKSVPPAPAEITYNCIVHGNIMKGKVSVSAPAPASAPAPIEAKPDRTWQPPDTSASVGDVIEWKMGVGNQALGMPHGVRITNWAAVKAHLEVEPVAGQQPFDETTGQNGNPSTTDGQVLLRLKIKSVPPAPAEITYNCIVHGNIMKGKVSVSAPAPASAPAPIEAKPDRTWQPPDTSASVGDVIEWKMGVGNQALGMPHGVRITNWAAVKAHLEVEPVAGQQPFDETTGQNGNPSTTDGQVLLRLKIKSVPPAPAEITYNCIVHGNIMKGKVSVQ